MATINNPAPNTLFALDRHTIQAGAYDPSVHATFGRAGSMFIQVAGNGSVTPIGFWQKQDNGTSTNWTPYGAGSVPTDIDYKDPVDSVNAFGVNVNLAAPGAVINGVTMSSGMSFLVVDQTISSENGIYDWNGAATPATRRVDCVNPLVTRGMFTWVNTGPTQRGLTGWILTTLNPINVGVTNLVFTQIPINASSSTRIAGIYWVGQNGNDSNPTTRGAIAAPFATIQAAINQAVAEGHGVNNPANVYVMAKSGVYAGFSTAIGVNVTGMAGLWFKNVNVGPSFITPDASGINNNTGNSLSNLQFTTGAGTALTWSGANLGRWKLINCRVANNDAANNALFFNSPGSVLEMDNTEVLNASTAAAMQTAGAFSTVDMWNHCSIQSQGAALAMGASAIVKANSTRFNAQISGAAIDCSGFLYAINCEIGFAGSTGDGFYVRSGAFAVDVNCDVIVDIAANGYTVFAGGNLRKSGISFSGLGTGFIESGTVSTVALTGVGYTPGSPANWPAPAPSDMKPALDTIAAQVSSVNMVYVDAVRGDDTTATGSELRPFQTVQAALALIAGLADANYTIQLAPGNYNGAAVAWPASVTKPVSLNGCPNANVNFDFSYTAVGGGSEVLLIQNVAFQNQLVFDLALGTIVTVLLANGSYGVKRIDALPPGPQIIRVFNSRADGMDLNSLVTYEGCYFVGGPSPNAIHASGLALMQACFFSGLACALDGTLEAMGSILQGTTFTGTGTLAADASSSVNVILAGGAVLSLVDDAHFLAYIPTTPANWPTVPTTVQQGLDLLAADAGAEKTSFVYKPGGVAGGNVYTSWATLIAAMAPAAGPKTIFIDDSIVSPAVIPAGAYDLTDVTLANGNPITQATVQVSDGVSFTNFNSVDSLIMNFLNTAVVETINASRTIKLRNASINGNGSAVVWDIATALPLVMYLEDFSKIQKGTVEVINVQAAQLIQVLMFDASQLGLDSVSGALGAQCFALLADSSCTADTQATFLGTYGVILEESAARVGFSPAVPGNWAVPPTEVAQALDELAANGGSTAIDSLYWVSENGNDGTGNGSLSKPFLTIQAAIAKAVLDGHGFANRAEVLVLPASAPYAGFTTANGINVTGIHGDHVQVGEIVLASDASGLATNLVVLSNLEVVANATVGIASSNGPNNSQWVFRNLKVTQNTNNEGIYLGTAGDDSLLDNCEVNNTVFSVALAANLGNVRAINGCKFTSLQYAIISGAGAVLNAEGMEASSSGAGFAAVTLQGAAEIRNSKISHSSAVAASDGILVDNAGFIATILGCATNVLGANNNINVLAGATCDQALVTFLGAVGYANVGTLGLYQTLWMTPEKATFTLAPADIVNQYITLGRRIIDDSIVVLWNAGQPPFRGDDYTLSLVGGVTRLSFTAGGTLATSALTGQKLQVNYNY